MFLERPDILCWLPGAIVPIPGGRAKVLFPVSLVYSFLTAASLIRMFIWDPLKPVCPPWLAPGRLLGHSTG